MKFQLLNKIPKDVGLAFSGGIDSVVIFHFLKQSKRNITLFFFNHNNEISFEEEAFAIQFAKDNNVKLYLGFSNIEKPKEDSKEEFWRKQRYEFLSDKAKIHNLQIITGHHLDDAVETWLWGSFNGKPLLLPYSRGDIIRPFLLTKKSQLVNYCTDNNLQYYEDNTNIDVKFARNRIRHNILPEVLKVNPGIYKVIKKKLIEKELKKYFNKEIEVIN